MPWKGAPPIQCAMANNSWRGLSPSLAATLDVGRAKKKPTHSIFQTWVGRKRFSFLFKIYWITPNNPFTPFKGPAVKNS